MTEGESDCRADKQSHRDERSFVLRVVRHLGIPLDEAEDATHEVLMILHRQRHAVPASATKPWLRAVSHHVCRNHKRARMRRAQRLVLVDANDWERDLSTGVLTHDHAELTRVWQALHTLDLHKQAVIQLSVLEGMTAAEIGVRLALSPNTVSARLRAAKRLLRDALSDAASS